MTLLLGAAALAALWLGPLPRLAAESFTAHMTLHMGVVAVAAPLLALGLAGGSFDPVRRAPEFFPPVPLSLVELAVVWAFHAPALHHAARHGAAGFAAEQGAFLVSGLLVWLSAFGGDPARSRARAGAGVAALLLTSTHMTLLGALLALAPRALYAHALEDQQFGGAVMLAVGGAAYLWGGLKLMSRLVREEPAA